MTSNQKRRSAMSIDTGTITAATVTTKTDIMTVIEATGTNIRAVTAANEDMMGNETGTMDGLDPELIMIGMDAAQYPHHPDPPHHIAVGDRPRHISPEEVALHLPTTDITPAHHRAIDKMVRDHPLTITRTVPTA